MWHGAEQKTADIPENDRDTDYSYTNKGATTEIYVDDVNEEVTVVKINYYMAEVNDIREDENGEYATIRMLTPNPETNPVDERDIYCEDFAEDDYVVVTVDENDDGDSFIATIAHPETVEGTVTRVKENSDPEGTDGNYVKLSDDTKYTYSKWTKGDLDEINTIHPTLDIDYRLYLDPNGYVIGFIALDNYYENYLYVEDADYYLGTIEAKVVLADGTSQVVTIDDKWVDNDDIIDGKQIVSGSQVANEYDNSKAAGLVGRAYAYTEDDGVYTLRQILDMSQIGKRPTDPMFKNYKDVAKDVDDKDAAIKNGAAFITINGTTYIVDEDTIFVDVDENTVYTGFENVPDYVSIQNDPVKFWAIDTRENDRVLDVVFIYSGEASNSNSVYFFVTDEDDFETYDRNSAYKEHNLYIDGEPTSLIFTQSGHSDVDQKGLYEVVHTNGDGAVTEAKFIASSAFSVAQAVGSRAFYLKDVPVGDQLKDVQYVTDTESVIVTVTYDRKDNGVDLKAPVVTLGDLRDMDPDKNANYTVTAYVAKDSDEGKVADLVYIVRVENKVGQSGPDYSNTYVTNATLNEDAGTITVKALPTATDKVATIIAEMEDNGYANIDVDAGSDKVKGTKDGHTYTYKIVTETAVKAKFVLDGTDFKDVSIVGADEFYTLDRVFSVTLKLTKDDGKPFSNPPTTVNLTGDVGIGLTGTVSTSADNMTVTIKATCTLTTGYDATVTISK